MRKRRIYVASSWRNFIQPFVVQILESLGHEVYDFRNPHIDGVSYEGFSWSFVDESWKNWTINRYMKELSNPIVEEGYLHDFTALNWADTGVLLLPCGRSAHLEAGYLRGQNKEVFALISPAGFEAELMYKLCTAVVVEPRELVDLIGKAEES